MGPKRCRSSATQDVQFGGEREISQTAEPATTANARIGPAILDGALPPDRALSFEESACAPVRAWLSFGRSAEER